MRNEPKNRIKKILILEPHLDDMEIGLSVWLKKMAMYQMEIHIVTFCYGRDEENGKERVKKRLENLELFKKEYPNLTIYNWYLHNMKDTTLDNYSIGYLIKEFSNLFDCNIKDYVAEFDFFKEIYIPQFDLHPDHTIVNQIGKILTRKFKGKVFEYIIRNSEYTNEHKYNTEIKTEFDFNNKNSVSKYIETCMYPTENIYFQNILHIQKNFDGKYISDRLNLIKDVFVASDRL